MSTAAVLTVKSSEAKMTSRAWRTPKVDKALKKLSLAWGWSVWENVQNSLRNKTKSLLLVLGVDCSLIWSKRVLRNRSSSWINETISTLLKKMMDDRVDNMLSSKTEGVGRTTSWMYCTLYVWWILLTSFWFPRGMTSLNRETDLTYSRCLFGVVWFGSYSKTPRTSKRASSESMASKRLFWFNRKMFLKISYSLCSPLMFCVDSRDLKTIKSLLMYSSFSKAVASFSLLNG